MVQKSTNYVNLICIFTFAFLPDFCTSFSNGKINHFIVSIGHLFSCFMCYSSVIYKLTRNFAQKLYQVSSAMMISFKKNVNFSVLFTILLIQIECSILVSGLSIGFRRDGTRNKIEVEKVLKNMDLSVDPCTDFYKFSCGGYIKNSTPRTRLFGLTMDGPGPQVDAYFDVVETIPKFLTSEIDIPGDISTAKQIYSNCIQLSGVSLDRDDVVQEIVDEMKMEWLSKLLKGNNLEGTFDFVDIVHKFREIGLNFRGLLGIYVTPRSDDDRRNILEIRRPILSQDYTVPDKLNVLTKELTSEKLYIVKAGDYFDSLNDTFALEKFVTGLMPEGVTFSRDNEIRVDKNYINKFIHFLKITPKENLAKFLSDKIVDELQNLLPPSGEPNYKLICTRMAFLYDHNFQVAVSNYFISEDAAIYVKKLFGNILQTLRKMIKNSNHLDIESKKMLAINMGKLQKLILYSNYTAKNPVLDWTHVDHKNYVQNLLKLTKSQMDVKFSQINSSVDVREWGDGYSPFSYSPIFSKPANSIYIPALYVAAVLYDSNLPNSLNYGSMGFSMAHELGHVMYSTLINSFDILGLVVTEMCLETEFDQHTNEINVNFTKKSYEEDFADLVGTNVAYRSYLESEKNYGPDDVLPGTKYTSRQLFWISGANFLCSKPDETDNGDGLHNPDSIRVLMTYANMPEFVRDFNCPVGSEMNSRTKCKFL